MVSEGWAVKVVERYLADWAVKPGGPTMVVTGSMSHLLGWVITSQGERYVRTRNISDMLIGHGYFLVDGVDGSLHMVHAGADLEHGEWIEEYLEQVRGVERVDPPDPLRSQVAELLAGEGGWMRSASFEQLRAFSDRKTPRNTSRR